MVIGGVSVTGSSSLLQPCLHTVLSAFGIGPRVTNVLSKKRTSGGRNGDSSQARSIFPRRGRPKDERMTHSRVAIGGRIFGC